MNTENELFGELHEQEENGLFGNEHKRQYEAQQKALCLSAVSGSLPSAEEMATIRLEKERGKNIELWVDGEQTEYWKEIYAMGVNDERSRAGNDR